MVVASLEVERFRNLRRIEFSCSPSLNLIVGENAAGKTSLLEALYFLSRGRSFRTRQIRELIQTDADAFQVVAGMVEQAGGRRIPVGVRRDHRDLVARIDGAPVRSLAELALRVPVLLLNSGTHQLLEGGPQQRRRFMDWGLFHGDQRFMPAWRRFSLALRNRNAALRSGAANRAVDAWDEELETAAGTLDRLRGTFCEALEGVLRPLIETTLVGVAVGVEYRRGWPQDENLTELLRRHREQDRREGHTRFGPQRADFLLKFDARPAQASVSRGQQKLLVGALVLAQARLYRRHRGSPCILLIDDLPSELDRRHRALLLDWLGGLDSQLFITAIETDAIDISPWPDACIRKLQRGELDTVV